MGLIHIYCGDGKGKTTAAVGLAIRYAGAGGSVLFYQFMKPETSSERPILSQIPQITVLSGYTISKFSFRMTAQEKADAAVGYQQQFAEIVQLVQQKKYGMLILDENGASVSANKTAGFGSRADRPQSGCAAFGTCGLRIRNL